MKLVPIRSLQSLNAKAIFQSVCVKVEKVFPYPKIFFRFYFYTCSFSVLYCSARLGFVVIVLFSNL